MQPSEKVKTKLDEEIQKANEAVDAVMGPYDESSMQLFKDCHRALTQVLDALGALSNPSALDGMGITGEDQTRLLADHFRAKLFIESLDQQAQAKADDDINPTVSALFVHGGRMRLSQLLCFPYPPRDLTRQQIAHRIRAALERLAAKVQPLQ